jgi:hypothetical protein
MPRRKVDAAVVVFALLVVATLAAFAYSERAKRDPLLVDKESFHPRAACREHLKLKFRTTTTNDHATVEVVRPNGKSVAVLASKQYLKRYSFHTYDWDGTNEGGHPAPPGPYRLRVLLESEGRTLTLPRTIHLRPARQEEC